MAKLNLDLIEHVKFNMMRNGVEPNSYEQHIIDEATARFGTGLTPHQVDLDFLNRDFGSLNIDALPRELTAGEVVADRMVEIDKALGAEAPLSAIFLAGSTLEGLLFEMAKAHSGRYVASAVAPMKKGKVKPLGEWTLSELITVSRDLGVLSEDVAKHSDQVRNFRNYIHPRQQLREGFKPRIETAQIAQQVLRAVLVDLEHVAMQPPDAG